MKPLNQIALIIAITTALATAAQGGGVFTSTGSPSLGRNGHTATLLPSGKVLVAGGEGFSTDSNGDLVVQDTTSAELFDPATGTWSPTGSLGEVRAWHTATLLPNGKVLVMGGSIYVGGYFAPVSSAELYNPTNGTWTTTGSPAHGGNPVLLPNGKVLVVGNNTAELYNPATGSWSSTGNPAGGGSTTLLLNGKVLVVGGSGTAQLYNPTNGTWAMTGGLITPRDNHTATLLPNGKVLVAGGRYPNSNSPVTNAEVYNPTTGTWAATGSLINPCDYGHTATLLANGQVLLAGGASQGIAQSIAELFDPATGTWSATGSLSNPRWNHTSTLLANGKVVVVGGVGSDGAPFIAELYDSAPTFLNPITNPMRLGDGSFQFSFSNPSGPSYRVLASASLTAPLNTWSNLGPATETPPGSGQFQFTDHQAPNYRQRFYRVTSP